MDSVSGQRLGESDLWALPPFLQLVCRARIEVGQVEVYERSPGKVFSTRVSLDVMAQNWIDACAWQARFGLTAAYATDAGTEVLKDADGRTRFDDAGDPWRWASRTCLLSDRLQRLSKPAAGLVRAAGCMCGGRWADTLISFTWSHCMFWCKASAYELRGAS